MEGRARLLFKTLKKDGWVDLLNLEFIYFADIGLSIKAGDDEIWRLAQSRGMIILTNNRNNEDETSLTAIISRENTETSLPVVTVGDADRLKESNYRQAVALGMAEVLFYLENYLGTGRVFIP
jgi:hypothetical protein